MGKRASSVLRPLRPPTAWLGGPPAIRDHRGPHRMGEGVSFTIEDT